jgi:hypothetical protein
MEGGLGERMMLAMSFTWIHRPNGK